MFRIQRLGLGGLSFVVCRLGTWSSHDLENLGCARGVEVFSLKVSDIMVRCDALVFKVLGIEVGCFELGLVAP